MKHFVILIKKWTLSIIGKFNSTDSYYKSLVSLTKYHNLENRVIFHNAIDDEAILIEQLKKSRVYLCLSNYEGYGMANIESATLGLPLVVSDLPVFRENLKGFNRVYTNSESASEIANAIRETSFDDNYRNIQTRKWKETGFSFKRVLNG